MTNLTQGDVVWLFQPRTDFCNPHWVETIVLTTSNEEGKLVFTTVLGVETLRGTRDSSAVFNEWSEDEQGKCWDFLPTSNPNEEQTRLFFSCFE